MPSEFYSTSLHSVNSPAFIKKYDKRANCLLSRSCHHCLVGAIIGPRPIRTRECVRICASVRVLALARQGRLLHARMNVQATRVTSSLLALVCQVSFDLYCTCTCSIWNAHSIIPGYKSGASLNTDKSGAGLYDSIIISDPILHRGSSELEGTSKSKLK